jgi:hypothetical protein
LKRWRRKSKGALREGQAVAADELSRSSAEISRQLTHTTNIVGLATSAARATDGAIGGLADGAQKIGDAVKLIRNIAGQTNLLALNATIEAARPRESVRSRNTLAVAASVGQQNSATSEISPPWRRRRSGTANARLGRGRSRRL